MKRKANIKAELDKALPKSQSDRLWREATARLDGYLARYSTLPRGVHIHTESRILPSAAIYLTVKEVIGPENAYGIIENAAKVRNETTNSVAISSMNLSPAYLRFCLAFSDNLPASLLTICLYYYTYRITGRHMAARLCFIYRLLLFYDFYL